MELHLAPGLKQDFTNAIRSERYLARLPLSEEKRQLLQQAAGEDPAQAVGALHRAMGAGKDLAENPAAASQAGRLELALGRDAEAPGIDLAAAVDGEQLRTMPPIERSSMSPKRWPPPLTFKPRRIFWPGRKQLLRVPRLRQIEGVVRRSMLSILTFGQTVLAAWSMTSILPYHGTRPMEIAILVLFAILFFWVSAGFWTAIMGFVLLITGRDRHAISATAAPDTPLAPSARTAVIMPICNEDVARVFAGLRATYTSIQATGALDHFDFFVLSDSNKADHRVGEVQAWLAMCRDLDGFGRVFYRWRRNRIKRKSGNVADFCRRWGSQYPYMLVLDADSVMSGECLVTLTRLMEANPNAGIIQTAPRASGRESLHARIQQFATRVYGPLFTAGLHFWQLGEAHYWGHNAIIRVQAFTEHCAIGRLTRQGVRNLEILSHDFVEAALMRRAGYGVWIAYDLPGSHEEMPPNLLDELQRDGRWCQGNLINSQLLLAEGVHPAHRVVFATGVMAYLSAPLWLLFLLLSTVLLAMQTLIPPEYFVLPNQLFPVWPEWNHEWAVLLFLATATLLFAPKILSVLLVWKQGSREFGGWLRVALSAAGEILYSMLLAPIRMLFHSRFVLATMTGGQMAWKSPPRDNAETSWGDAIRNHGLHTLFGAAWGGLVWWLNASYVLWLSPVVGALMLSIPISVLASRVTVGRRLRRGRIFLIPEEATPPPELRALRAQQRRVPAPSGFVDAVTDPLLNAVVCAAAGHTRHSEIRHAWHQTLVDKAVVGGPDALAAHDKLELLDDPEALSALHFAVWSAAEVHPAWGALEPLRCEPTTSTELVLPANPASGMEVIAA